MCEGHACGVVQAHNALYLIEQVGSGTWPTWMDKGGPSWFLAVLPQGGSGAGKDTEEFESM